LQHGSDGRDWTAKNADEATSYLETRLEQLGLEKTPLVLDAGAMTALGMMQVFDSLGMIQSP